MYNTLAEADDALSMNLSAIIRNGTDDQLRQTEYAQPALFAISIGIMRVVSARINIRPSFLAGHSAGEYSALHAAGSLSFADAIRTLKIRGQAMQNGCNNLSSLAFAALVAFRSEVPTKPSIVIRIASLCHTYICLIYIFAATMWQWIGCLN